MKKEYKNYQDRLLEYEADKRKLQEKNLTSKEYEEEIRKLIEKHRI